MIPAPVNVKLERPKSVDPKRWKTEADEWNRLGMGVGANPAFFPLTFKAFYVLGLMHSFFQSVTVLLQDSSLVTTTYLPAYAVFASRIELLGRCINGNNKTSGTVEDLKTGFKWLAQPVPGAYGHVKDNETLVVTSSDKYSIEYLVQLRHFSAHGQATSKPVPEIRSIDYEILSKMPTLVARGIEVYWSGLQHNEDMCERLARANVRPFRNEPMFNTLLLITFRRGEYPSIESVFQKYDWRVGGYRSGNPAAVSDDIAKHFHDP